MVVSEDMNTTTPSSEEKRPLRIFGIGLSLITGIVVIAWLAINIVNAVPGSFASLASLAESVRSYQLQDNGTETMSELIVTSDSNVVTSGSSVRLDWTAATVPGSFVLSYECTDGVAIDLTDAAGTRSLSCGTNYNLGNVTTATVTIDSEKSRYVDIPYSVGFLTTDGTEPVATDNKVLTVVNDAIAIVFDTSPTTGVSTSTTSTETETPTTPVTPTTPLTPGTPTYTTEYTYAIPVSDPNGRIDLSARFLNNGRISGNSFVSGTIDRDDEGAVQFEVKNIGTKTSGTWTYELTLPDGERYESTSQTALKPNERAVITIGFGPALKASHTFTVSIKSTGDRSALNNEFSQLVRFTN